VVTFFDASKTGKQDMPAGKEIIVLNKNNTNCRWASRKEKKDAKKNIEGLKRPASQCYVRKFRFWKKKHIYIVK
jgi:hypothetical protein